MDGTHVLVADKPEQFAAAVLRAYYDETIWGHLVAGGLKLQETYFSASAAVVGLTLVLSMLEGKDQVVREKSQAQDGHHRVCMDMKSAGMELELARHGCEWYAQKHTTN